MSNTPSSPTGGEAAAAGTTLEILAPYLPYQLEVHNRFAGRGQLLGLHAHKALVHYGYDKEVETSDYHKLLPVLRDFSALCSPLADGTVPLIEAAKLACKEYAGAFVLDIVGDGKSCTVRGSGLPYPSVSAEDDYPYFNIATDWKISVWGGCDYKIDVAAAIDYLRSKHFAVGLEPGQFIPKEAALTPEAERGGSRG